jgi:hypothetical protein
LVSATKWENQGRIVRAHQAAKYRDCNIGESQEWEIEDAEEVVNEEEASVGKGKKSVSASGSRLGAIAFAAAAGRDPASRARPVLAQCYKDLQNRKEKR